MARRLLEFTGLFWAVFAATFLLSRAGAFIPQPAPPSLIAVATTATRLVFQPPDEQIAMPVPYLRVRQIGDTWHALRSGRRRHEGQDIFAPTGTPIYSATNGILIRMGDKGKGGNAISVLGTGGRIYYYAHLDHFATGLHIGDRVTTETLLGYVGITGNAVGTPAHLHFAVYSFADAINPLTLLANRH